MNRLLWQAPTMVNKDHCSFEKVLHSESIKMYAAKGNNDPKK